MNKMKIAHISDLHINTELKKSNLDKLARLLRKLNKRKIDHLCITGDLSDTSNPDDLEKIRSLLFKYDFLDSERTSMVIGNHDIYGGLHKLEDFLVFPDRCRKTDYEAKVNFFNECFSEINRTCFYISNEPEYTFGKIVGPLLITGWNSIARYSGITNPFASNGLISKHQMKELADICSNYKANIKYHIHLLHHHFNKIDASNDLLARKLWLNIEKQTMKLRGKKKILKVLDKCGVDIVLHGHVHEMQEYEQHGIKFYNSASLMCDEDSLNFYMLKLSRGLHKAKETVIYPKKITEPAILKLETA